MAALDDSTGWQATPTSVPSAQSEQADATTNVRRLHCEIFFYDELPTMHPAFTGKDWKGSYLIKASEIHDTLIDYRIKHIDKWTAYLRQEQRRPSLSDSQALRRIEAAVREAVVIEGAERTLPRTRDLHLEQARLLAHALHQHQYNLIWNRRGRLNHGVWFLTVKLAGDNLIDLLIKVQRFTGDFSDDEVRQIHTEPLIYSALEKMWSIALQLYRMKNFGTKPTEPRACPCFAMDLLAPMQLDALQLTKTILLQWLVDAAQQYDDWITEGALPATDQAPMLNNI